jgi:hypothetical protein
MKLHHLERSYSFRSRGLFQFLQILQEGYPGWVDLAGIKARLPGIDPRQLARFIDLLEKAELPLVRYETKTRGPFKLAVMPDSITFSGEQERLAEIATATPSPLTPIGIIPLAVYQDEAWVAWVIALVHSTLALHDGYHSEENDALKFLDAAEAACHTLPLWTISVVHVRRASILEKASHYREATYWLRRVDTAVRQGHAHPAAQARVQLIRVRMHYDQAHYAEAERMLALPSGHGAENHCPHRLNMQALITGRKFLASSDIDAPLLLSQTLSLLSEAIGHVFLWHGDTSLLDALCYNFANNLLRGIKRGLIPEACADTVMQWLVANMLTCRKLGVGEDSVLANLLLIDVGLDHGYTIERWPHLLHYELSTSRDLAGLLAKALAQARKTDNQLEIAQCLKRKVRLATSQESARRAYLEAVALFRKQGRKDVLLELADTWRNRFGISPPTLPKGHTTKISTSSP